MIKEIGSVNINKITLLDGLDMYIEIDHLSDKMMGLVNEKVEEQKKIFSADNHIMMEKFGFKWCEEGVTISPSIRVVVPMEIPVIKNNGIQMELSIFFADKEEEDLCDTVNIPLDLSGEEMMKQIVADALINRIFGSR